MKLKLLTYLLPALLLTAGCSKEAAMQPIVVEPMYTLPQGNHPYDKAIVDFYQNYGTYILYRFTEKDFRWNITNLIAYTAEQGDENYVEPALAALDKYLFKFYPAAFLKKALPYKIILAARIKGVTQDNYINTVSTYSHFAFGRAGSTLAGLTEAQLKTMKGELNREFWRQAVSYNKIALPPAFVAATDYTTLTAANRRSYGVFTLVSGQQNVYGDFLDYIYNLSLQTPQELEQTVFTATNDPAGKFRLKYNAVISYFKEVYGVDLQAIAKG
ncbi:hypothetical protein ABIE26_004098 [Pedobacter africanus]|uniref:Uncharacterized protein n=1 Tax=Pedobacter africanus TaxID=151894 RepID=A0ACC6L252_9SPHI|nr:hypothetical protein [Pedobacter africanus]MDR6785388.1 hypothetical protein [Pedobacter africanus]